MPESREEDSHNYVFEKNFKELHENGESFQLIGIHADASKPEEPSYDAKDGHVVKLSPNCNMVRGSRGHQTHLFPSAFAQTAEVSNPPPLTNLTLQKSHSASRAIILDFGGYFLKVAYLTHTSIQFYTRKQWEQSILSVNKKDRGFHVGVALEFKNYFIAFLSNDLVFQPLWGDSLSELKNGYVDVYHDYPSFLELVAGWISKRRSSNSKRLRLVCEVMRSANDVWFAVGVYTICEILFLAGVSPFLSECEVFNNASRTARICEAFWSYKHKSISDLPSLLNPCIYDRVLAPTLTQRLRYKSWLHVYAKEESVVTPRMANLIDAYKVTIENIETSNSVSYRSTFSPPFYDVFEPNYMKDAFEKELHLGDLIFGKDAWTAYGKLPGKPSALSRIFAGQEKYTFLRQDLYASLFVPFSRNMWHHRPTFTYRATKQVWSVTPNFPVQSQISPHLKTSSKQEIVQVTGIDRHAMLFSTIVANTKAVAIGPLEYCGNGKIIELPHGKKVVSIVRHDPSIPQYYAQRELNGLERKSAGLNRRGTRRRTLTTVQKTKRTAKETVKEDQSCSMPPPCLSSSTSLYSSSPSPSTSSLPGPLSNAENILSGVPVAKKRRLSADKALALSMLVGSEKENDTDCFRRRRRAP